MKMNKMLSFIIAAFLITVVPAVVYGEDALPELLDGSSIEDVVSLEPEITSETLSELSSELESTESKAPGGFSRFFSGIGDAFTADKTQRAIRAMERVRENKLRILKLMKEKQEGLYSSEKFSEELNKLQGYIDADSEKAQNSLGSLSEDASEKEFAAMNQVQNRVMVQSALDKMIGEEIKNTISKSNDLSSSALDMIRKTETKSIENTKKISAKASEKELKIAAKMISSGKKSEQLDSLVKKYVEKKEESRIRTEQRTESGSGSGSGVQERTREETRTGDSSGDSTQKAAESKSSDSGSASDSKPATDSGSNQSKDVLPSSSVGKTK